MADVAAPVATAPASPKPSRKNYDLLGWGIFLTATAAAAMAWVGIDWPVTAASAFLLLLSFATVWYVSSAPPAVPPVDSAAAPERVPAMAGPLPAQTSAPAAQEPAPAPAPAASPEPTAVSPAPAGGDVPLTRKQMRAADPTTGVMPVISVFARKPGPAAAQTPASAPTPARSGSSGPAAETAVPLAPAGQLLQGINAGPVKADSRRAHRAGTVATATATASKTGAAAATAPATAGSPVPDAAGPVTAGPVPDAAGPVTADAEEGAESRWTRVFGPPETGQLPIQRYDAAAASAVDIAAPDAGTPERGQRSHSSL